MTKSNLGGAGAVAYELKWAEGLGLQLTAIHAHRGYFVTYTADAVVEAYTSLRSERSP